MRVNSLGQRPHHFTLVDNLNGQDFAFHNARQKGGHLPLVPTTNHTNISTPTSNVCPLIPHGKQMDCCLVRIDNKTSGNSPYNNKICKSEKKKLPLVLPIRR